MQLDNQTGNEPIYEVENGNGSGGGITPPLRKRWAGEEGHNPHGDNPHIAIDGSGEVLGFGGQLKAGRTHFSGLTKSAIAIRFFVSVGSETRCKKFVVDRGTNYTLTGNSCAEYALNPPPLEESAAEPVPALQETR